MLAVLLDTNVWSWTLLRSEALSRAARTALETAQTRFLSPVSFYEVAQKARLGKWPEIAPHVPQLRQLAEQQGLTLARLDAGICLRAALFDWRHRDPFDRLLAATALSYGMAIVSADPIFEGVVERIW